MDHAPQNTAPNTALEEATRTRGRFSGRGKALGMAGYVDPSDVSGQYDFLTHTGEALALSPPDGTHFGRIKIGAAWNNVQVPRTDLIGRLLQKTRPANIDVDLGCLYELQDGRRGAIQALGDLMGSYKSLPHIRLSGDETTGDSDGDDECMYINGAEWSQISRILVYIYIYDGAEDWAQVKPQIQICLPDMKPVVVTLSTHMRDLPLCTIAELRNVRNGIAVTNFTEYFPGHAEMDRAYGFGLEWADGTKDGVKDQT
ncbi:MAG: Tellurium resistance protein TerA [Pseudomonadota bacterium]